MKISAIICEYNPFHAGHLYHIGQTRVQTGCDHVIAIMSGSFVQRGLPAIYDKWIRTDAALACGADLVIELPQAYSCASAERFAYGGVRIAELTGIVDTLSFGCETTDLSLLKKLSALFTEEPADYTAQLKQNLSEGVSYARARSDAAEQFVPGASALLSQSNAILAVEYLKSLKRIGSDIIPFPVLRAGNAAEQSTEISEKYASALAIRTALQQHRPLPAGILPTEHLFADKQPVFADGLSELLLYRLRTASAEQLSEIAEVGEGLEFKILAAARSAQNYSELLAGIKSKRYPQSRIQRILINCLLCVTKTLLEQIDAAPYIRVLGVKKESRHLLSLLSSHAEAPVVTSPAGMTEKGLQLDILATDIRALCGQNKTAGRDYTEKLHIL